MLSDRNYMSTEINGDNAVSGMKMVLALLGVNIVFFLLIPQESDLYRDMVLSSGALMHFCVWTPLTAMFLHGSFGHLFLNMWGLYLFGTIVAPVLGAKRFLTLYLISGVFGNLLWLLFNWGGIGGVVGASGALFGIMLVTAMLYPDKEFMILFLPVPMKTKTLVVVYAVIEIFSQLSINDNVAHLAHLGGFIGAYVYIKFLFGNNMPWDLLGFLFSGKTSGAKMPAGWVFSGTGKKQEENVDNLEHHFNNPDVPVSQRELDQILNKISYSGINSLSEAEMATLKKAREQMRRQQ